MKSRSKKAGEPQSTAVVREGDDEEEDNDNGGSAGVLMLPRVLLTDVMRLSLAEMFRNANLGGEGSGGGERAGDDIFPVI